MDWWQSAQDTLKAILVAICLGLLVLVLTACAAKPNKPPPGIAIWTVGHYPAGNGVWKRGPWVEDGISYSNSMAPTMMPGDPLAVDFSFPYTLLQEGDIIVFYHGEDEPAAVHRLIHQVGQEWQTKGDNNTYPDSKLINADDYIGKVVAYGRILK
ncbi:signal peptidase I [Cerasicoccus frondis]|uniref:signal peptidase I n=1 Tax=Cerasicoccus frondis TaxID=490090 RepID=UPI0028526946|nr:signal peptidase I [Cerasicoccus frondis]